MRTEEESNCIQWRIQDLKEGGAKPIACKARAQKFKPRPQTLTTPLANTFLKIAG